MKGLSKINLWSSDPSTTNLFLMSVPWKTVIELKPSIDYEASISADGFENTILNPGEKIIVTKSPNNALFLRAHQPDFFYEALNMRLGLAYRTQRQAE